MCVRKSVCAHKYDTLQKHCELNSGNKIPKEKQRRFFPNKQPGDFSISPPSTSVSGPTSDNTTRNYWSSVAVQAITGAVAAPCHRSLSGYNQRLNR